MATQLTTLQKALLDAADAVLDEAFLHGCEYPPGTNVVPSIEGYALLQSVNGTDVRPQVKSIFKTALVSMMKGLDPLHFVGSAGEPPFTAAWQNYDTTYNAAAFYKDPFLRVFLQGLVKPTGVSGSGTIFQLPAAYRPLRRCLFIVQGADVGYAPQVRVDVDTDGTVSLVNPASLQNWVSLDGLNFRVP